MYFICSVYIYVIMTSAVAVKHLCLYMNVYLSQASDKFSNEGSWCNLLSLLWELTPFYKIECIYFTIVVYTYIFAVKYHEDCFFVIL